MVFLEKKVLKNLEEMIFFILKNYGRFDQIIIIIFKISTVKFVVRIAKYLQVEFSCQRMLELLVVRSKNDKYSLYIYEKNKLAIILVY